jgi:hypothetical protein
MTTTEQLARLLLTAAVSEHGRMPTRDLNLCTLVAAQAAVALREVYRFLDAWGNPDDPVAARALAEGERMQSLLADCAAELELEPAELMVLLDLDQCPRQAQVAIGRAIAGEI